MDWSALVRAELDGMVPYSPGLRGSEVRDRSGHEQVLKLSSNEWPEGPFPVVVRAIRTVSERVNRYPDGSTRALKRRLTEEIGIGREHLVVGSGSNEILRLIAQVVLRPGDEVVYAWPSFVVYPMISQMFGARSIRVPLVDEAHDLEAMAEAVTERTRLMILCNPNNPTGTIYRREAFERFLAGMPEHVLVVVDEAYFEFVDDPEYPDGLAYFDGARPLVVTRTFSKIHSLAGVRVGYAAMPEPLVSAVERVREPFNVSSVAQVAAYYSLGETEAVLARKHANIQTRTVIEKALDRAALDRAPSETNFVYVSTPHARPLFDALLDDGVIVRDFGTAPALRITVCLPEDADRLARAIGAAAERLPVGAA